MRKSIQIIMASAWVASTAMSAAPRAASANENPEVLSRSMREVRKALGPDGASIRPVLVGLLTGFSRIKIAGNTPKIIESIAARGLKEDILNTRYDLLDTCVVDGAEKSAATQVTDVDVPGTPRPPICINLAKLAAEKASAQDIAGLLMHEHARHFGQEDTEYGIYHPIGAFFAANYARLLELADALPLKNGMAVKVFKDRSFTAKVRLYSSTPGEFVVEAAQAEGSGCPLVEIETRTYENGSVEELGNLVPRKPYSVTPTSILDFSQGNEGWYLWRHLTSKSCVLALSASGPSGTAKVPFKLPLTRDGVISYGVSIDILKFAATE
jgi:hypothetical protein